MFNIDGTFYGRDGETEVKRTNITLAEVRRTLAKDLYLGFVDEVAESDTIPNGFVFYSEEAEAAVIALDTESHEQLKKFVDAVIDSGQLFIEGETPEDDQWADGTPMDEEDRTAAIIG